MNSTVFVSNDVSDEKYRRIVEMVQAELLRNCNLSGAEIVVERGETTYVDGIDEYLGVHLLNKVRRIVDSEDAQADTQNEIKRGSSDDKLAYLWAQKNQGYEGDFAAWCEMPMKERLSYEEGASHGDPTREIVARD